MMTAGLMTLLVLGIALSALWGAKYDPERNSFMSVEDSTFLRGLWCIIVVLVHIPKAYQNRIQDMLGSFAYIGVTFFFLTSAYGLKYSLIHKKAYMNHFWRRRLPGILIPALVANAVGVLINAAGGEPIAALSFLHINSWVKVLLLYYLIFWLVYHILPRFTGAGRWQDVAMCAIVIVISRVDRLTPFKITSIWIVEPLGFAYGIIAANHGDEIKRWMGDRWGSKSVGLMVLSGVLGVAYLKFKPVAFAGDYLLKIALGLAITAFIFTVLCRVRVGNRVNRFLGSISYEVYLMHHAVFALLMLINPSGMNSGAFVVASVIVTVAFAWILKAVCGPLIRAVPKD
jgi:peptidoglycan/LPS O-acetylase OafA/YrhL